MTLQSGTMLGPYEVLALLGVASQSRARQQAVNQSRDREGAGKGAVTQC